MLLSQYHILSLGVTARTRITWGPPRLFLTSRHPPECTFTLSGFPKSHAYDCPHSCRCEPSFSKPMCLQRAFRSPSCRACKASGSGNGVTPDDVTLRFGMIRRNGRLRQEPDEGTRASDLSSCEQGPLYIARTLLKDHNCCLLSMLTRI